MASIWGLPLFVNGVKAVRTLLLQLREQEAPLLLPVPSPSFLMLPGNWVSSPLHLSMMTFLKLIQFLVPLFFFFFFETSRFFFFF